MNLAAAPGANHDDEERGRQPHRSGATQNKNPFDDDAATSLRGVSPRPIDTTAAQKQSPKADEPNSAGSSPTERKSIFRENV
jgi:hypothetical protein